MVNPRHEALVGAAMLGLVKANGWMEMPIAIDVNRAIEDAGPVQMTRQDAVRFARSLIDEVCKANDWPLPDYSDRDEQVVAIALGRAYDELTKVAA
jgi:hypothetical protein